MDRHIPFDALHNVRDLGGLTTTDGLRIRPGLLYRADSLGKLSPDTPDWDRFLSLGIGTVVDLRRPWEIETHGRIPAHPSFRYHHLSIEHRAYDQAALNTEADLSAYLTQRYLEVAEEGAQEIAQALHLIAEAATTGTPLIFHCASGKDRTGLVAALTLSLLNTPTATIVEDFTLTELAAPALLADWTARHGHPPQWLAFGRAPAEVMRHLLTHLTARHGSIEAYVTESLHLDARTISTTLRTRLLEEPTYSQDELTFRQATDSDAPTLVRLRDSAALWMLARGIDQWKPGEKDETHFRTRIREGEVWLAHHGDHLAGAYELWWDDPAAWGPRPPEAGYIHRLMTTPHTAPPGTGRALLTHAESRIKAHGHPYARLDCLATNPHLRTYYEKAGYKVVGEQQAKKDGKGSPYAVTLLEKQLSP
ncbi:GNAT family N-acetyltransferase [Streptomyces sp. 15-116A]|uniref:GNAT family N-acetyltransferase n=1 Tax=Streptomyces sp. 15-116A TaxID=2259035 RepID=UPI0021B333AD|nr:GNAT family N-acetyltransferase [Streptomyces sp. 15-116A]MCT7353343.1 GNAT family N-acetyltransferase [Streptomyces sp. 15-116A]